MSPPAIGFSQRIKLEWMADTARMVSDGRTHAEIVSALREGLEDHVSVGQNPERGTREKVITILLKTWVRVGADHRSFRDQGLRLLNRLPTDFHLAIYWGAAIAAYPFFGEVAQIIGRLFSLQNEVTAPQVQRRLKERFGEKETVARAARRIQRTFIDWGVVRESGLKGVYVPGAQVRLVDAELLVWIAEAAIRGSEGRMKLVGEIRKSLAFFPFDISGIDSTTLPSNDRLNVFRQGIDEHWVNLRTWPETVEEGSI